MKSLNTNPRLMLLTTTIILFSAALGWWLFNAANQSNRPDESAALYAGPFKLQVKINPAQPKVGNNNLTIWIYDEDNQPVTDAQISAIAEMPAMGSMPAMRAPASMEHIKNGVYEGQFELSMNGAWPLSLSIDSSNTGNAELKFNLTTGRVGLRLTSSTSSTFSTDTSDESQESNGSVVEAGQYRIQVQVQPDPPVAGKNTLTIIVKDDSGQAVSGAKVRAVAQMPAMGSMKKMNAPADIRETESGIYSGELTLGMKGEWPLAVDVESDALGHGDLVFDMATGRKGIELSSATPGDISHYTCSMHPSVKSAAPGSCPICSMDLVAVTKKEMQSGSISMDARRRQLIGVTTGVAEVKHLTQTIRAAGRVTYDETRLTDVTLKFSGWIGKLKADYLGTSVTKNQPLFSVYSPELLSAQQEYLETLHRRKSINSTLLNAARQRLTLWDIASSQITQLEARQRPLEYLPIMSPATGVVVEKNIVEGSAVKTGQKLFRIADLSSVWIEGEIYEYEIPLVKTGMEVRITLPDQTGKNLMGKLAYIYPYLEGDTRTAKIRVQIDNSEGLLKPDMYAQLYLNVELGPRLVVPESAVLYAGESRVVFIDMGNGQLQPRKIKTGVRNEDDIEVLDGLEVGDKVVTSGNFLIAAESKLKSGINQW